MDLAKGWINRQITRLEKEYLTWPDWMKRERNQKMDNFIGTWRTRDGSKVEVIEQCLGRDEFWGKVLLPYGSAPLMVWDSFGNSLTQTELDLMERISEKDPRR